MSTIDWEELYGVAEKGLAAAAVPEGEYDAVVVRAEPYAQSNVIFLGLEILNGPMQGKGSDVSIYFPKEGDKRGAQAHFAKKIAGFMGYPDVKAAFLAARNAPTVEDGLGLVATTLLNKQIGAKLRLVEEGQYAGQNELTASKRIGEAATDAAQVVPAETPQIEGSGVPAVGADAPF